MPIEKAPACEAPAKESARESSDSRLPMYAPTIHSERNVVDDGNLFEHSDTVFAQSGSSPTTASVGLQETLLQRAPTRYKTSHERDADGAYARGSILGRYAIIKVIGSGGMGIVYAAYDPELDRRLAIKVLRPDLSHTDEVGMWLLAEAKAMARLSHPNVCTIYEIGTVDNSVFIAMEYVDGQTLAQWLGAQKRSWREVLAVMASAGRGLASAHKAGIVHRDFKPTNIMIDRDDRVRIMDFGVAYRVTEGIRATDKEVHAASSNPAIEIPGIAASSFVGTIGYIAPEQIDKPSADERSDQFAFCVTLYEALYRHKPYRGTSLAEVMVAFERGDHPDFPQQPRVPRWLVQVVAQGLALDPAERHQSMDALIKSIEQIPRRRRAALIGVTGVSLLLAVVVATVWLTRQTSQQHHRACSSAIERVEAVWNQQRSASVATALAKAGIPDAAAQQIRLESVLTEYASQWQTMHTDACEATRIRGEQSEEMLDRRMLCLDERLGQLEALVALLEQSDGELARRAVEMAMRLPSTSDCSARASLLSAMPLPDNDAAAQRVVDIRKQLADVRVRVDAGRYRTALPDAKQLVSRAAEEEYPPVLAESWYLLGSLHGLMGDFRASEQALLKAITYAELAQDDVLRARALTEAVFYTASGGDTAGGEKWALLAHAALTRSAGGDRLRSRLLRNEGTLLYFLNRMEEAFEKHLAALELRERVYGPQHFAVIESLNEVGLMATKLGQFERGLKYQQQALETAQRVLGPEHPKVADCLNNLGNWHGERGDIERATSFYNRALAIWTAALGPKHPMVAVALSNLGAMAMADQDLDKAISLYQRALTIERLRLDDSSFNSAVTQSNIGMILLQKEQFKAAEESLQRAYEGFGDTRSIEVAATGFALAQARARLGRPAEARQLASEARAMYVEAEGTDSEAGTEVADWLADL